LLSNSRHVAVQGRERAAPPAR